MSRWLTAYIYDKIRLLLTALVCSAILGVLIVARECLPQKLGFLVDLVSLAVFLLCLRYTSLRRVILRYSYRLAVKAQRIEELKPENLTPELRSDPLLQKGEGKIVERSQIEVVRLKVKARVK